MISLSIGHTINIKKFILRVLNDKCSNGRKSGKKHKHQKKY